MYEHNGITFNFSDRDWHPYPPDRLRELGIGGHGVWHNPALKVGALAVRRSLQYTEFAVAKAGVDYVFTAEQEGRIDTGYVVLLERNEQVIRVIPVREIVAALEGTPPRQGRLGEYWWFNADGTPYSHNKDYIPF